MFSDELHFNIKCPENVIDCKKKVIELLTNKFKYEMSPVNLEESSSDKVEASTPRLVYCVVSSRIGTDIDNALDGVERGYVLILLI